MITSATRARPAWIAVLVLVGLFLMHGLGSAPEPEPPAASAHHASPHGAPGAVSAASAPSVAAAPPGSSAAAVPSGDTSSTGGGTCTPDHHGAPTAHCGSALFAGIALSAPGDAPALAADRGALASAGPGIHASRIPPALSLHELSISRT